MTAERRPTRTSRTADLVVMAAFLAIIGLPLVDSWLHIDPIPPLDEQRAKTPPPASIDSLNALEKFPSRFERYFDDHFGFRNLLVRSYGAAMLFGFGLSPTNRVVAGKQGWLFADDEVAYFRNEHPFTADELDQWRRVLERRQDWLAERGCRYVFVVVPNKSTIYPEMLPGTVRRIGERSRLDQLMSYLAERSRVSVLDVRPQLASAKKTSRSPIYHPTDTHWNLRGGFAAYHEIVTAIQAWFPSVVPARERDFRIRAHRWEGSDLGRMTGVEKLLADEYVAYRPRKGRQPPRAVKAELALPKGMLLGAQADSTFATEIPDVSLPRAVMFRDSFAEGLLPFLPEHFSRFVSFRCAFKNDPENPFEPALVEQEHPDVVITEIVERFLRGPAPRMLDLPTAPGR